MSRCRECRHSFCDSCGGPRLKRAEWYRVSRFDETQYADVPIGIVAQYCGLCWRGPRVKQPYEGYCAPCATPDVVVTRKATSVTVTNTERESR